MQLQHNYIGTEHILLGLVREGAGSGGGTGAQILRQHSADLVPIRLAVLDLRPGGPGRRPAGAAAGCAAAPRAGPGEEAGPGESELRITPAADPVSEAARLAG